MRHHPKTTLVTTPNETAAPPPAEVVSSPPPGARGEYLQAHPRAAKVHAALAREFRDKYSEFAARAKSAVQELISTAELSRQIGIVLIEFADTLPGKKITIDLWQQHKHEFTDALGQPVPLEMMEWLMKTARSELAPITDLKGADKWRQPVWLGSGEFALLAERPPQIMHGITPPLMQLKAMLNSQRLGEILTQLRNDRNYCSEGRLREDLRAVLLVELNPTFTLVDDLKQMLT